MRRRRRRGWLPRPVTRNHSAVGGPLGLDPQDRYWTKATVQASPSRLDPIVVSAGGRATVLMASSARIYKRTQLP